jgi:hypothetical protein
MIQIVFHFHIYICMENSIIENWLLVWYIAVDYRLKSIEEHILFI